MRRYILFFAVLVLAATSCITQKEILYFQDIETRDSEKILTGYEPVIKRDDELSIIVSGPDKSVIMPYNLTLSDNITSSGNISQGVLTYIVDSDGYIDYPTIGKIYVLGLTRRELTDRLTEELKKEINDPIVSVSFKNFKVTVLGEVKSPGTYNVTSNRITILQAIGMAGDLTLSARRDGIILLREIDGEQTHQLIDLKESEILNSPYFYLQQNDVLYIPPSSSRVTVSSNSQLWSLIISTITATIAVISLIK